MGRFPIRRGPWTRSTLCATAYGADLVALFVAAPAGGTCGIAYVPSFGEYPMDDFESLGFSVTAPGVRGIGLQRLHTRDRPQPGRAARPVQRGLPDGAGFLRRGGELPLALRTLQHRSGMAHGDGLRLESARRLPAEHPAVLEPGHLVSGESRPETQIGATTAGCCWRQRSVSPTSGSRSRSRHHPRPLRTASRPPCPTSPRRALGTPPWCGCSTTRRSRTRCR